MSAIEASLRLEISQYQQQLAKATGEVRKFKESARQESRGMGESIFGKISDYALPIAGVAATLGTGLKAVISDFDDLADTALKLNESTEVIQRVKYAAEQSGTSIDGVSASALRLEKALGDVENAKAAEALERLGISAQSLAEMTLEEKMIALSGAFEKARAEGTGYNDIVTLMGKSAGDLIPLLSAGKEGLEAMFGEAPVLADGAVQSMARLNDQVDGFIANTKAGLGATISLFQNLGSWIDGGSFESAFSTPDSVAQEEKAREQKRLAAAAAQEENRRAAEAAAAAEAEAKAAKDKLEKQERIRALQQQITTTEIARLGPADQLVRLTDLQRQKIDEMRAAGGLFYEATVSGMAAFAAAQANNGSEGAEETLRKYQEVLRIQQQIVGLNSSLRTDTADNSAESAKVKAAEAEAWWNQIITDEKERQAQADARTSISEEVALLQAKANGQTQLVEAMERELAIRAKTAEIMSRTGMGEEEARNAAARIEALRGQADARANAGAAGAGAPGADRQEDRDKILGFSRKRQGGAYERQDHLYTPDPNRPQNRAGTDPNQSLGPQAQRNAQKEGPQNTSNGTAPLGEQVIAMMKEMLGLMK